MVPLTTDPVDRPPNSSRPNPRPLAAPLGEAEAGLATSAINDWAPSQPRNQQVGGSLAHFWEAWSTFVAPGPVLNILREGYVLPIARKITLSETPISFRQSSPEVLDQLVQDLVDKAAVELAPCPPDKGFYSHIFAVPKSSGGHRLVINLRVLNKHLKVPSFRMETNT